MWKLEMPTDPIQRASAVASDYDSLQGLITLAAGAGLILMALAVDPVFGAVLVAVSVPIGQRYYYKKYGKVRQSSSQSFAAAVSAVIVVVVACAGIMADAALRGPVLLGTLSGAAALLVFCAVNYRHVGATRIHVATIGVLAASSLLPLIGLVADAPYWRADVAVIGLALVVVGAVDHHRLTNAMRPVVDE